MRRSVRPKTRLWDRLRYTWLWTGGLLRYTAWRAWARLSGQHTQERRAVAARRILEGLGPVGVLVGRQLAMRVELVRLTMSLELSRLQSSAPPFGVEVAIARLEEITGRPIAETFAAIDPEPIASGPVSCIWLAERTDGTRVTLCVRRPGIREELAAAFGVLGVVARTFESLSALVPGLFDALEQDLDDVLLNGTDFIWTGRLQMVLRERLERDGPEGMSAPMVYPEWLAEDVRVAEAVDALPLTDLIAAVECGDQPMLKRLARRGIEPEAVARRLLQLSWWQVLEASFFEAEPGADRIAVRTGGELVVVFIEDCAILPRRHRRLVREALVRLADDDVSGAADALIRAMAPLPRVDVHELRRTLEGRLSDALHRSKNPEAPWLWRTSVGIWTALLDATGERGVGLRPGLARALRSDMTVSVVAGRLWPEIDLWQAFADYRVTAQPRLLAAADRRAELSSLRPRDARAIRYTLLRRTARSGLRLLEGVVDAAPVRMHALQGKGAYAVAVGLRALALGIGTTLGLIAATAVWHGSSPSEAIDSVLSHPMWVLGAVTLALLVVRVILFRLDDLDRGR